MLGWCWPWLCDFSRHNTPLLMPVLTELSFCIERCWYSFSYLLESSSRLIFPPFLPLCSTVGCSSALKKTFHYVTELADILREQLTNSIGCLLLEKKQRGTSWVSPHHQVEVSVSHWWGLQLILRILNTTLIHLGTSRPNVSIPYHTCASMQLFYTFPLSTFFSLIIYHSIHWSVVLIWT